MTVLLVLFFFAFFLLIDYFLSRKNPMRVYRAPRLPQPALVPALINGFSLPRNLHYHLGHTWALSESPALVRVGMDDFAAKMIGKIDSIVLPQRNTWVRQGTKLATITRDGKTVELLSPVEGIVTEVNTDAIQNPEKTRKDPYNKGWLAVINSPDQKVSLRNILNGDTIRWWIEDAVNRLHPAMAQDGGEACDDFLTAINRAWEPTCREFFLN